MNILGGIDKKFDDIEHFFAEEINFQRFGERLKRIRVKLSGKCSKEFKNILQDL